MNKLQRIEEMERQLAALKAEVEQEAKPKQWEPEGGGFLCHHTGFIVYSNEGDFASKINGCAYKTEKQAEKAAAAMRTHNRLLAYVAEFAPDYEFLFNSENAYVTKNAHGKYVHVADVFTLDIGKVYMPVSVAIELCRKLNSGEVVL